jgi:hypothetical protein
MCRVVLVFFYNNPTRARRSTVYAQTQSWKWQKVGGREGRREEEERDGGRRTRGTEGGGREGRREEEERDRGRRKREGLEKQQGVGVCVDSIMTN